MTREEIIDFCEMKSQLEPENEDIFNYIIKALEQEPSGDLISRQAVLNTLDRMDKALDTDRTVESYKELLTECYKDLPSVKQEPCEDAISRQAVLNQIFYSTDNSGDVVLGSALRHRIENLPPVEQEPKSETVTEFADRCRECGAKYGKLLKQEPKTGHWIEDAKTYYEELNKRGLGVDEYTPYFTDDIACSECLAKYSMLDNETQFFKYCPNCGAKMESGR